WTKTLGRDAGTSPKPRPVGPARPCQRSQGARPQRARLSSNPMMEGPWCRFQREARARERYYPMVEAEQTNRSPEHAIRELPPECRRHAVCFHKGKADIPDIRTTIPDCPVTKGTAYTFVQ